jgi:hypothetical protein
MSATFCGHADSVTPVRHPPSRSRCSCRNSGVPAWAFSRRCRRCPGRRRPHRRCRGRCRRCRIDRRSSRWHLLTSGNSPPRRSRNSHPGRCVRPVLASLHSTSTRLVMSASSAGRRDTPNRRPPWHHLRHASPGARDEDRNTHERGHHHYRNVDPHKGGLELQCLRRGETGDPEYQRNVVDAATQ